MKYYNIIYNTVKIILFGTLFFWSQSLIAQLSTQTPYSGFGLGEINNHRAVSLFGLGGVSAGWHDEFNINSANPASYSFLRATTFQIEGFSKLNTLSNSNSSQQVNSSGLDNINFVFKKRNSPSSFAFGLRKYANTGYQITDSISTSDYNVNYYYEGSGGINDLNLGYSYVFNLKNFNGLFEPNPSLDSLDREKLYIVRHRISLGANFDWMFGNTSQIKQTIFDNNTYVNSRVTNDLSLNDYNFTLGMQAKFNLFQTGILKRETVRKKLDLNFGVAYTMAKDVVAKRTFLTEALYTDPVVVDSNVDQKGYASLPERLDIGGGLSFVKNGKSLQWGINFQQQDWSSFKLVFGDQTIAGNSVKASVLGTGFEFTPMEYDKSSNFFGLITYRIGARTTKTYWNINDKNIEENALTAGISFPLLGSKSFSKINFGMEIGTRGTTDQGLIQENFTNFMVGFTFTPHYYNRWFVVRKYD